MLVNLNENAVNEFKAKNKITKSFEGDEEKLVKWEEDVWERGNMR